ncbi:enoyl-CoA hydratase/isomerase family protein [Tautonia plasticadhaerens]|uniref:Putative enoyl-CoA hydratase echA8 n=1 Tax=Tautonia plasticadhaerens TaxID=2527974 RepID=A0A518HF06_9BACT|nr:enoyl-CoA hydratase-related protein [Tautonia plasticadhaerens]QDV39356.1 putative enoyl-CoA hydratase echA8 [Tautonia plasticadhaerens]
MSEPVLLDDEVRPGVVALTLNRPGRRNALNMALMRELCGAIDRHSADPSARVLILRGNGPVFCAGLDLEEAANLNTAEEGAEWVRRLLDTLSGTPLVTICEAHGAAFAGGAGLLACCDFAVAAEGLRIGFPEVRRGLVPALVSMVLTHTLRDADLRELFLLAEPIDAHRALAMGLVHRVVAEDRVRDESARLAGLVLEGAPEAVRETKRLLGQVRAALGGVAEQVALEAHARARVSDEAREGLAAFLEKRKPRWT